MIPATMRASFYEGPGRFATGSVPTPAPARGEALLRVRRVGICGTDLHIFQGHLDHRVPRGGVIGHETFAEVVEAPKDSGFAAGDRVVVEPVVFCGACRACRMGASYLCYQLKVLGVDLPGGMREYYPVTTDHLLKVPDALGDDAAAVIEPLAVATHDVTRSPCLTPAADRSARSSGWCVGSAAPRWSSPRSTSSALACSAPSAFRRLDATATP